MRTGRRLALDVGKARIGVAISDPYGILASPVGNLPRLDTDEATISSWLAFTKQHELLDEVEILEVYVGLPVSLSGTATESTRDAVGFGQRFGEALGVQVRWLDERLTTVSAASNLRQSGINSKSGKGLIDSAAAMLILEQALSTERNGNSLPGLDYDTAVRNFGI